MERELERRVGVGELELEGGVGVGELEGEGDSLANSKEFLTLDLLENIPLEITGATEKTAF